MNYSKIGLLVVGCLTFAQQVSAREAQPNAQIIAQAFDRCMATYAVKLTKTAASDDSIYSQAKEGCQTLENRLTTAIREQTAPAQADELLRIMAAEQAEPTFKLMLSKIRSDRTLRETARPNG